MAAASCLVDTNILLRLLQPNNPDYNMIRQCTDKLWHEGAILFYTSQNLAEFWNVCTRPISRNGCGFSIVETNRRATLIEARLTFAPDSEATHREWRKIILEEAVSGVQVHDARLVAAMHVHRIEQLLTLNIQDFQRYRDIVVVSPHDLFS
ncbi:type II toxin-antitoxin system VapC family toxin [Granulicella arctica]|uniref:type II toxin-antitoxin system VapC family toxin n=1 Tax=Granulicella arctica TaxID=940613 RepID=UPI0021E01477|nr:type II toxin-antitoxin system VapC family toxin [Granulicella arctica]